MEEYHIKPRVAILCPTRDRPSQAFLDALEASVPFLDEAGYEHAASFEIGCPYISGARAKMLRRAMQWRADIFVFIDDDVSWAPHDLVTLIGTPGDVVGGTYRFKTDDEGAYMGVVLVDDNQRCIVRSDGAVKAVKLPAGFLKVTRSAIDRFMAAYPELTITSMDGKNSGGPFSSPDLFNHGAWHGVWFGEDYAFCRNWMEAGGEIWLVPNLDLDHNGKDAEGKPKAWKGNYHEFLLRCPGGSLDPNRLAP